MSKTILGSPPVLGLGVDLLAMQPSPRPIAHPCARGHAHDHARPDPHALSG